MLAGGRSSRMGRDKALLAYQGTDFVSHAVSVLEQAGLAVRVVTDAPEKLSHLLVPVLVDRIPLVGPLAALSTALAASDSPDNYFLSCDTPLVPSRLYSILARESDGFDIVVPQDGRNRKHLLCAYYSRRCLAFAEQLLSQGVRRVESMLEIEGLRTGTLPTAEWEISDESFVNVNTPKDLERLRFLQDRKSTSRPSLFTSRPEDKDSGSR